MGIFKIVHLNKLIIFRNVSIWKWIFKRIYFIFKNLQKKKKSHHISAAVSFWKVKPNYTMDLRVR